ncbi:acyl-CoA thioester hydrolase/BAAT C-terminal domain-containing protein [Cytophagales bacterium LB-30]|uniref:Acyl-CoA thioester hydrolase/BAAT C-terminal domain-containing protein n=1 Tax=Shiella aurantiaca TaxID=3058365 RepID=A0ABT8F5Z4_9BACT|nr:acyl-CoA thioester hydrolase/BAAT C-terminal domain-containing protein [Shiella aurantiaca]MDN4165897.1 acyl-CoA thioester hydrolase/BAAT C-terminal domain-containing protein [Shiella aurantiaca]
MKKVFYLLGLLLMVIASIVVYLGVSTPSLSAHHGGLDTHLYLGDSANQPLIVAFGGGSGGNDWERNYLKDIRDELLARGFAVLAIAYFNTEQTPSTLDRISLNAISDTILHVANRYPQIDTSRIILLGSSKGGELVLNLASRFTHFKGVIALSTSHVSFPALTLSANTSSWEYNKEEVPYVPAPFKTLGPALRGDLYGAFSLMLEDQEAVAHAEIAVEKINGPILILSGTQDDQWPATHMSQQLINRLAKNNFTHSYNHIPLEGGHTEPLHHFDWVYDFLEKEFIK